MLGAKAAGKSDAEVIRMGEQWQADAMRQGSESARSQPRLTPEAASAYRANAARPQAAAEDMVRRGTGGHPQRRPSHTAAAQSCACALSVASAVTDTLALALAFTRTWAGAFARPSAEPRRQR